MIYYGLVYSGFRPIETCPCCLPILVAPAPAACLPLTAVRRICVPGLGGEARCVLHALQLEFSHANLTLEYQGGLQQGLGVRGGTGMGTPPQ